MAEPKQSSEVNRAPQPEPRVHDRQGLVNLLQPLHFPVSRSEVIRQFGHTELLWTQSDPITLDDVVMDIPQETFESLEDLTEAICSTIRLAYGDHSVINQSPLFTD